MAFADKIFMEEEKDFIKSLAKKLNISKEKLSILINEIEKTEDITEFCRKTARDIAKKEDRDVAIKLLSEMITADKIVHRKEIFALQVIAEEWEMYLE